MLRVGAVDCVLGKLRKARHQLKTCANGLEFIYPLAIVLLLGQFQIGERDRIGSVAAQSDEAEPEPA